MEKISLEDFEKKYMQPKENWDFDLFKIVCKKCGSDKVEYAGEMETDYGYYGSFYVEHKIIVKCHDCGNALAMKNTGGGYCDN